MVVLALIRPLEVFFFNAHPTVRRPRSRPRNCLEDYESCLVLEHIWNPQEKERGMSGFPSWTCCLCNLTINKQQKMDGHTDGQMDGHAGHNSCASFTFSYEVFKMQHVHQTHISPDVTDVLYGPLLLELNVGH